MINEYNTIIENISSQIVEKKSKFICNLIHIESEKQAKEEINKIKKKNYDARHSVFAYIVFENEQIIEKFSDDGEPSGTAGKPLLEILKQKQLVNVLVCVTRYFGGILLGTGGLLRAYSNSAMECINNSKIFNMVNSDIICIELNYDEIDKIKYYCEKNNFEIRKIDYLEKIKVYIVVNYLEYDFFIENIKKMLDRNADILTIKKIFVKK